MFIDYKQWLFTGHVLSVDQGYRQGTWTRVLARDEDYFRKAVV